MAWDISSPTFLKPPGWTKNVPSTPSIPLGNVNKHTMVLTEDTGKQLEMAICLAYNTPYVGKYKYGMEEPERLATRLRDLLPPLEGVYHSAEKGAVYDFTAPGDHHLSAKSTKKTGAKVAPQQVGQASVPTFCDRMSITQMEPDQLKSYLQENIESLLAKFEECTFDCPILFFDKQKDSLRYIKRESNFRWAGRTFTWTKSADQWANSSTLKVDGVSVMEIQFHTTRKNMACRWCFENVLSLQSEHLSVVLA